LVLLALLLLGSLIAWIPIAALAGILLVIAYRMLDGQIFRLLFQKSGRLDFAVIAVVIGVALSRDLIAAAGVGIGMAILLFIRDQVRGSVIRRKRYLDEISSKTQRAVSESARFSAVSGIKAWFVSCKAICFSGPRISSSPNWNRTSGPSVLF
jgi:SulP family sulfate permease